MGSSLRLASVNLRKMTGEVFRYFIYSPHNYNNYLKMPKEKNVGRDGEEA